MTWNRQWIACAGLLIVAVAAARAVEAFNPVDKTMYTKVNVWFEKKDNIPSTNYHRGTIIPVGSKATITAFGGGKIRFKTDSSGDVYTILLVPKHTPVDLAKLFEQYFSEASVMESNKIFGGFTRAEKESIKEGKVEEGMSKEAVLAAYGYPPSHRTPSTTGDTWLYWISRGQTLEVRFENGKVKETRTGGPR
jgi:hypothetical protein